MKRFPRTPVDRICYVCEELFTDESWYFNPSPWFPCPECKKLVEACKHFPHEVAKRLYRIEKRLEALEEARAACEENPC